MNNAKTHATPDQTEQTMPWMLRLLEKSFWIMLFLGFSAGLPYSLVFGTLSLWLQEAGISKSTITFFSWAGLGYSFKFIWAPLIDQARLPWLSLKLGKRRAWLLVTQVLLVIILLAMAMTDPHECRFIQFGISVGNDFSRWGSVYFIGFFWFVFN